MPSHRYVALDVETTGLSLRLGDRIIEIGLVAIENNQIVEKFSSLICTDTPISYQAYNVHQITNEMLIGQPGPDEVIPHINHFIRKSILLAHNANFDIRFLNNEFNRLNLSLNHDYVCTMELSRRRFPHLPNHKLGTVANHLLGNSYQNLRLHRALGDATLVALIWLAMEKR